MSAVDKFKNSSYNKMIIAAEEDFSITPHDTNELSFVTRAIFIGTGGNVAVVLKNSGASRIYKNLPDGYVLPVRAKKVLASGTTATDLIGML